MNLAQAYMKKGEYDKANKTFDEVLKKDKEKKFEVKALLGKGQVLKSQQKYKDALKQYEAVAKIDPENADA